MVIGQLKLGWMTNRRDGGRGIAQGNEERVLVRTRVGKVLEGEDGATAGSGEPADGVHGGGGGYGRGRGDIMGWRGRWWGGGRM